MALQELEPAKLWAYIGARATSDGPWTKLAGGVGVSWRTLSEIQRRLGAERIERARVEWTNTAVDWPRVEASPTVYGAAYEVRDLAQVPRLRRDDDDAGTLQQLTRVLSAAAPVKTGRVDTFERPPRAAWAIRMPTDGSPRPPAGRTRRTLQPDAMLPGVYETLRRIAALYMRRERSHTLRPTDLVHEAWLKLASGRGAYAGVGGASPRWPPAPCARCWWTGRGRTPAPSAAAARSA